MTPIPNWMTPLTQAVERVIDNCNPAVPSAPLIAMDEAESLLEMQPAMNDLDENHPLFLLMDAVSETYWGFYPETEYGSASAHISMEGLSALAEAFGEFKTAMQTYEEPIDG